MNHKRVPHFFFSAAILPAVVILIASACQKQKPPAEEAVAVPAMDRAGPSPTGESQPVLHKTFTVKTSANFSFEVPLHAATPRLHGNFKSFLTQAGVRSNEDSANVDFFVLTEDQYAVFAQSGTGDTLFSADASHDQEVDVRLPPALTQPEKFYLVFRSSAGSDPKKIVDADLSVDY